MPWNNNQGGPKSGGPWGGGGGSGGRNNGPKSPWGGGPTGGGPGSGGPGSGGPGRGGGGGGQGPNIDDIFKKGQSQLKNVLGNGGGGSGFGILLGLLVLAGAWLSASFYAVKQEEQAVVLTFGDYTRTDGPGLNFAPWPVQTAEIRAVRTENVINIGNTESGARSRGGQRDPGIMLTGDQNIIDVNFQVGWNIRELDKFLFNLAEPEVTIRSVAESAMREVVGRSQLAPLLNRDRELLARQVHDLIQVTMDEYQSGVQVTRVSLDRADPPPEVIDAFRDVQAAEQERDTKQKQAQGYYNQVTAAARGEAAQMREEAEGYRARVVAGAQGEAARFVSIYDEYVQAKDVTRKRLYLETMERVFGGMNKVIIDENSSGGQGVVPYLPLNQLQSGGSNRAVGN